MVKTAQHSPEHSVTSDIIRKVHLTLADLKTGEEMLEFLRNTEPVFMNEVSRFIEVEIGRMKGHLEYQQAMYIGSVIGASYIAGFLIAREANHKVFNGLFSFESDIKQALTPGEFDRIADTKRREGKSYKEIARAVRSMIDKKTKPVKSPKKVDIKKGKRIDIGGLE